MMFVAHYLSRVVLVGVALGAFRRVHSGADFQRRKASPGGEPRGLQNSWHRKGNRGALWRAKMGQIGHPFAA